MGLEEEAGQQKLVAFLHFVDVELVDQAAFALVVVPVELERWAGTDLQAVLMMAVECHRACDESLELQ